VEAVFRRLHISAAMYGAIEEIVGENSEELDSTVSARKPVPQSSRNKKKATKSGSIPKKSRK